LQLAHFFSRNIKRLNIGRINTLISFSLVNQIYSCLVLPKVRRIQLVDAYLSSLDLFWYINTTNDIYWSIIRSFIYFKLKIFWQILDISMHFYYCRAFSHCQEAAYIHVEDYDLYLLVTVDKVKTVSIDIRAKFLEESRKSRVKLTLSILFSKNKYEFHKSVICLLIKYPYR
jgi:hypothetical protein